MTRREDDSRDDCAAREAEHRRSRLERMAGNIAAGLVTQSQYYQMSHHGLFVLLPDDVARDATAVAEAILRLTRGA